MNVIDEDFVTVVEAAALLAVAPSTVRRWIREGNVPAYRVGRRRVALRRSELTAVIAPIRTRAEEDSGVTHGAHVEIPRLTPDEKEQALAAMERAEQRGKEILVRRGGEPFPPAWETINQQRDERTRQLT